MSRSTRVHYGGVEMNNFLYQTVESALLAPHQRTFWFHLPIFSRSWPKGLHSTAAKATTRDIAMRDFASLASSSKRTLFRVDLSSGWERLASGVNLANACGFFSVLSLVAKGRRIDQAGEASRPPRLIWAGLLRLSLHIAFTEQK